MASRYFFGKSVKESDVFPSRARSFAEVVKMHLEQTYPLRKTREAYHALETKAEKLDAKDAPYLLPCTFKDGEHSRAHEHLPVECNLLCVDIDESKDARQLIAKPDTLIRELGAWNFAAYTTASSTPEAPRLRVMMDADALPPDVYRQAVQFVGAKLGLSAVTGESLKPKQPMILPCRFIDDDPETFHPLILRHLEGRAITLKDLEEKLDRPLPPTTPSKGGKVNLAQGFHTSEEDDGLEFLRAPLLGFTLSMARDALQHLSPSCAYDQWLDVAAALKHQFGHLDEADASYELFDSWSGSSDKYAGPEDTAAKWNSLKPSPSGRLPVTIRTLIRRANDAGWNAAPAKAACLKSVQDWILHEAKSVDDLTTGALEKLASLPFMSASDEGRVLSTICTKLKECFQEKVTVQMLAKDLKVLRAKRDQIKDAESKRKEPPSLTGWCFVTKDERFVRPVTGQRISADAVDKAYGREFLPDPKKTNDQGLELSEDEKSRPTLLPHLYLLNIQKCLICDDYIYDPMNATNPYPTDQSGLRLVNTYRPPLVQADKDRMQQAQELWFRHMSKLIAEPEYQKFITDYIAYMVQFPGRKIRWAICIQGAEGCGKSWLSKVAGACLGDDNVKFINNDILRGQWTEWATGAQLVILSEIRVSGQNRHDIMNRLKEAITDDRIPINQRARDARTVPNVTNYIGFTNFTDALAVSKGSRRWFVLKSLLQTEEQVFDLGEDYFDALFADINENPGGYRAFFEEWPISDDFDPDGRAPKTVYLDEMIADSADSVTSLLRDLIAEDQHPLIQEDLLSQEILQVALEGEGMRESDQYLTRVLRENGYDKAGRTVINDVKHTLWVKKGKMSKDLKVASAVAHERQTGETINQEEDWI